MYEENLIKIINPPYMLMFSAKWLGEKKVSTYALPDYPTYKKDRRDDKELCLELHRLMSSADIIVAHNGDAFDAKKSRVRFIAHKFPCLPPVKQVDTLKIARKHFGFTSNRLNDLAQFLGVGSKLPHEGFHTWEGCMEGDPKAWRILRRYGSHDTELLERVYLRLRPWASNHPNVNIFNGDIRCPRCQSFKYQHRGTRVAVTRKYESLQCQGCGHWFRGEAIK